MSRKVYDRVRWMDGLRGWGGSEAAISLKAFFLGIPLLHLCGQRTRHLFKKSFPYRVTAEEVWRNHALIARVCFDDRTWFEYWLPDIFNRQLSDAAQRDVDSESVRQEQREFQRQKTRSDPEFWYRMLKSAPPQCLRTTSAGWRQASLGRRNRK
jgi:hypothetical protein